MTPLISALCGKVRFFVNSCEKSYSAMRPISISVPWSTNKARKTQKLLLKSHSPLPSQRMSVWCGFWFGEVIAAFYFENATDRRVTVNVLRYR